MNVLTSHPELHRRQYCWVFAFSEFPLYVLQALFVGTALCHLLILSVLINCTRTTFIFVSVSISSIACGSVINSVTFVFRHPRFNHLLATFYKNSALFIRRHEHVWWLLQIHETCDYVDVSKLGLLYKRSLLLDMVTGTGYVPNSYLLPLNGKR